MGLHELPEWELPEQILQLTVPGLVERAAILPELQSCNHVGPGALVAGQSGAIPVALEVHSYDHHLVVWKAFGPSMTVHMTHLSERLEQPRSCQSPCNSQECDHSPTILLLYPQDILMRLRPTACLDGAVHWTLCSQ